MTPASSMTSIPDENNAGPYDNERNAGLFLLDIELETRYFAALESIGLAPPEEYHTLQNYVLEQCFLQTGRRNGLCVDRTGYSPQVAGVLGEEYLLGHIVLLSTKQFGASGKRDRVEAVVREYSNLTDLVDVASRKFRTLVLNVLGSEALVISCTYTLAAADGSYDLTSLLRGLGEEGRKFTLVEPGVCLHEVAMHAFTPSGAIEGARLAVGTIDDISEDTIDDLLLGERREELELCASEVRRLARHYGRHELYSLASAPTEHVVRLERPFRYRSSRAGGGEVIVDVVPSDKPFLVYHGDPLALAREFPFEIISLSDAARLMDRVFEAGYIELDPDRMDRTLQAIGVRTLREAGYRPESVRECQTDLMMLHRELSREEVRAHLPDEWFALRDMYLMLRNSDEQWFTPRERERLRELYPTLSAESKLAVSVPSEKLLQDTDIAGFISQWIPGLEIPESPSTPRGSGGEGGGSW